MCVHAHECLCPLRPEEGFRSPEDGLTGVCKPNDAGARVLETELGLEPCKSRICS